MFLRYPGGKSRHTAKILKYFRDEEKDYREPFVGGGSVFLSGNFENAWINDIDPEIYSLWMLVKNDPDYLIHLIQEHSKILDHNREPKKIGQAIDLWKRIKSDVDHKDFLPGYRALFLIKTCFNGVKSGGPTGGLHQTGKYTLFSRWAESKTIKHISIAHEKLKNTRVTNEPWERLTDGDDNTVLYLDPPYLEKGSQCYDFNFSIEDHQRFAALVSQCSCRFVVTIDDCELSRSIWKDLVQEKYMMTETWLYSMSDYRQANRVGKELFIVDPVSYELFKSRLSRKKVMKEYD